MLDRTGCYNEKRHIPTPFLVKIVVSGIISLYKIICSNKLWDTPYSLISLFSPELWNIILFILTHNYAEVGFIGCCLNLLWLVTIFHFLTLRNAWRYQCNKGFFFLLWLTDIFIFLLDLFFFEVFKIKFLLFVSIRNEIKTNLLKKGN